MPHRVVSAIAACLACTTPREFGMLEKLAQRVLEVNVAEPARSDVATLQAAIDDVLPAGEDQLALVYGGVTKVKDFVFESPKLPEIRGASALLDWVNRDAAPQALHAALATKFIDALALSADAAAYLAEACVIYKAGGTLLVVAPASMGPDLANLIERTYIAETLTAQSIAVSIDVPLIGLRYGRDPLGYWVEQLLSDLQAPAAPDTQLQRQRQRLLTAYYAPLPGQDPDDLSPAAMRQRFYRRKTFGELVSVLTTEFYKRREDQSMTPTSRLPRATPSFPLMPWAVKCASSDVRPAVYHGPIGDGGERRWLSEASARKRYVGQIVKRQDPGATRWFRDSFDWDVQLTSWEQTWEAYLERADSRYAQAQVERGISGIVRPAQDVNQIGAASRGYIGMVYADGNNIGRLIAAQPSLLAYADVSVRLRETLERAVFAALDEHLTPFRVSGPRSLWVHPFEILTIGGDDVLLLVPANQALQIALSIGLNFEQQLSDTRPGRRDPDRYASRRDPNFENRHAYLPRVGLSAGVVIAQDSAPIFFLRDLVDELVGKAKALARLRAQNRSAPDNGGGVDFMVLKSFSNVTDDLATFRLEAFGDAGYDNDAGTRRLTARPYSWRELDGLLHTVRALKAAQLPRSQLHRLEAVLTQTRGVSSVAGSLEYLQTRARLGTNNADVLYEHIDQAWRGWPTALNGAGPVVPPWLPMAEGGWETIWSDLVEIYDFVEY